MIEKVVFEIAGLENKYLTVKKEDFELIIDGDGADWAVNVRVFGEGWTTYVSEEILNFSSYKELLP